MRRYQCRLCQKSVCTACSPIIDSEGTRLCVACERKQEEERAATLARLEYVWGKEHTGPLGISLVPCGINAAPETPDEPASEPSDGSSSSSTTSCSDRTTTNVDRDTDRSNSDQGCQLATEDEQQEQVELGLGSDHEPTGVMLAPLREDQDGYPNPAWGPGSRLLLINGRDATSCSFREVMGILKLQPRPLTLRFEASAEVVTESSHGPVISLHRSRGHAATFANLHPEALLGASRMAEELLEKRLDAGLRALQKAKGSVKSGSGGGGEHPEVGAEIYEAVRESFITFEEKQMELRAELAAMNEVLFELQCTILKTPRKERAQLKRQAAELSDRVAERVEAIAALQPSDLTMEGIVRLEAAVAMSFSHLERQQLRAKGELLSQEVASMDIAPGTVALNLKRELDDSIRQLREVAREDNLLRMSFHEEDESEQMTEEEATELRRALSVGEFAEPAGDGSTADAELQHSMAGWLG